MLTSLIYTTLLFLFHYIWNKVAYNLNIKLFKRIKEGLTDEKKRFSFIWRTCSSCHAIIMFLLSLNYWFFIVPNSRTINFSSMSPLESYEIFTMDIMVGFLWYDLIVELSQTRQLDTLAHHIFGLLVHFFTRLTNNHASCYYTMMVYIAEGSTPWLNICWLFFNIKELDNIIYKISSFNLMVMFFLCRVCMATYMFWHLNQYAKDWAWETEPNINQLFAFNYFVVIFFVVLNYYWFYKLVIMAVGINDYDQYFHLLFNLILFILIGGTKAISKDDKSI